MYPWFNKILLCSWLILAGRRQMVEMSGREVYEEYWLFTEGYSVYIGMASALCCRKASIKQYLVINKVIIKTENSVNNTAAVRSSSRRHVHTCILSTAVGSYFRILYYCCCSMGWNSLERVETTPRRRCFRSVGERVKVMTSRACHLLCYFLRR